MVLMPLFEVLLNMKQLAMGPTIWITLTKTLHFLQTVHFHSSSTDFPLAVAGWHVKGSRSTALFNTKIGVRIYGVSTLEDKATYHIWEPSCVQDLL